MPAEHSKFAYLWERRFWFLLAIAVGIPLVIVIYLAARFLPDRPVTYANIEDHFKYGSTGGERSSGFPYYIWQAMPKVCSQHIPQNGRPGFEAFGLVYEKGKDLPVGVMKRRNMGIDRVFVNCAVCHHTTVRDTPASEPRLYLATGAAKFDLGAFEQFLFDCVSDEKFRVEYVVPEVERVAGGLSALDRYLVYPVAIGIMRARLIMLKDRFEAFRPLTWGPGRVDTFNSAKALFNFPFHQLPQSELWGAADFPPIWNQRPREGMQLHWDGNNTKVNERNKSAAFGTGTTPATIDLKAIGRLETWLLDLKAPRYPYPIDQAKAAAGAPLYKQLCADCHGQDGSNFAGKWVGKVTHINDIGTDRFRLDSYTYDLAANQSTLYAGEPYRFTHFRKTFGYANMPLDGIWLRAPYLHNGSVPTLRALLEPSAQRPPVFWRGYDVFDQAGVGFVSNVPAEGRRTFYRFDTKAIANSNKGHEGPAYGTTLSPAQKDAIVEYLKTF